jgi:Cu-Zn family superoxide dismutase
MHLNNFIMRKSFLSALVFGLIINSSCSSMRSNTANKQAKGIISATKPEMPGEGTISFSQEGNEVMMKLDISFPSKAGKSVAVHIHEHGDCGDAGNNAHGHWNPNKSKHGKWGAAEYHLGDIGNVQLDQSGKGSLKMKTDKWSIGTGAANDIIGKGIIVHDGVDDYVTQPTGNAGSRIGCGVIALVP